MFDCGMSRMDESCHLKRSTTVCTNTTISKWNAPISKWHAPRMRVSRVTFDWVIARIGKSCIENKWVVSNMNESHHLKRSMTVYTNISIAKWHAHIYGWVVSRMNESCHIWMNDITNRNWMSYIKCEWDISEGVNDSLREVGGWGRDPKKCTGRGWGMGSSTI